VSSLSTQLESSKSDARHHVEQLKDRAASKVCGLCGLAFHTGSRFILAHNYFTVIVQSMYSITEEQNGDPFLLRRNELTWPAFLTWSHSSAEPVDLLPSYANQRKMYVLV